VAVDGATDTIYVATGNNANGASPGGNTVSVIDGRRCQARDVSRCPGPWPTVRIGNLPSSITVDQATNTVYVTVDGNNTIAVFNGATCNARNTTGCGQSPAHVRVGPGPFGIFADDVNHTVYVANPGPTGSNNTMSMINTLTCYGSDLAGCAAQKPPTVPVGVGLADFDVNQATHTVYVGLGDAGGGTVAAFDARTCNARVLSGCGRIGTLMVPFAQFVSAVSVDSASNTIYAAGAPNTIEVFDGRTCNATDLARCAAQQAGTVTVAPNQPSEVALSLVVDAPLHTVYVVNQKDDTLSAVNTKICNGSHLAACGRLRPPTVHTGEDPEAVAVNPGTQTLYTANQVTGDVSVIDATRCNATTTRGCRQPPPAITLPGPGGLAADPAVATVYIPTGSETVAMIDSRACNARRLAGCTGRPARARVGTDLAGFAVNPQTHTVYVANAGTGNVTVLDDRACNATTTRGCQNARTLQIPGGNPDGIAIDAATGSLYVATLTSSGPNLISVFNAATCNATHTAGCGQTPAVLKVGDSAGGNSALSLAVNQATNTIYATNVVTNTVPFGGDSVYVFNAATCNATNHIGCGQIPATITAGFNPWGITVDQATDTIYTANIADGEHPGTVSAINGATCNGTDHTGCGQTPTAVAAGFGAVSVAVDPATDTVYVANGLDTSVTVINGATCNGTVTTSCHGPQPRFPVGRAPGSIAIDPAVQTIYTANGDNTISITPAHR
jgi:DNA-binding beta-propeller fold protein YncE